MRFKFDEGDKERIAEAIRRMETSTSGEIFCVLARSSGSYRSYPLLLALVISLLVPLPLLYFTFTSAIAIYVTQLVIALALLILFMRRSVRFAMVPRRVKRDRAHAEAQRLFAAYGLQQTEARSGVLIFVSLAECYVEIVADAGIAGKAGKGVWDEAVAVLSQAIRRDDLANGFIEAIGICGKVLAENFPPDAVNKDELPNRLVLL